MTTFDRNLSGSRARETLSECKELHKKRGRHPIQLLYEDFFEQSYVCLRSAIYREHILSNTHTVCLRSAKGRPTKQNKLLENLGKPHLRICFRRLPCRMRKCQKRHSLYTGKRDLLQRTLMSITPFGIVHFFVSGRGRLCDGGRLETVGPGESLRWEPVETVGPGGYLRHRA